MIDFRQLNQVLAELVPLKGDNTSDVARKLGISSQRLGQYISGAKEPGTAFIVLWKKTFGENLITLMTETNVSHETNVSNQSASDNSQPHNTGIDAIIKIVNDANEKVLAEKELRRQDSQDRIAFLERMWEKGILSLLSNSEQIKETAFSLQEQQRAEHTVMMKAFDVLLENPAGTLAKEAGKLEIAARKLSQGKDKKISPST